MFSFFFRNWFPLGLPVLCFSQVEDHNRLWAYNGLENITLFHSLNNLLDIGVQILVVHEAEVPTLDAVESSEYFLAS